jgi:hypothetical protein
MSDQHADDAQWRPLSEADVWITIREAEEILKGLSGGLNYRAEFMRLASGGFVASQVLNQRDRAADVTQDDLKKAMLWWSELPGWPDEDHTSFLDGDVLVSRSEVRELALELERRAHREKERLRVHQPRRVWTPLHALAWIRTRTDIGFFKASYWLDIGKPSDRVSDAFGFQFLRTTIAQNYCSCGKPAAELWARSEDACVCLIGAWDSFVGALLDGEIVASKADASTRVEAAIPAVQFRRASIDIAASTYSLTGLADIVHLDADEIRRKWPAQREATTLSREAVLQWLAQWYDFSQSADQRAAKEHFEKDHPWVTGFSDTFDAYWVEARAGAPRGRPRSGTYYFPGIPENLRPRRGLVDNI